MSSLVYIDITWRDFSNYPKHRVEFGTYANVEFYNGNLE